MNHSSSHDNKVDPSKSHDGLPPADPSNTSHIGQRVEQEIISKTDGITEQSTQWEESEDEKAAEYLKHPSPEDRGV